MRVIRGFWKSGRISRTIGPRLGIISVVCVVVSLCASFTVSENVENGSNSTTSVSKGTSGPSAPSGPSGPSGPSLLTTNFASMKNITFKMLGIKQKPKGRNGKKITVKKVTTPPAPKSTSASSSTSTSTGKVVKATPSISTTTVTPVRLQAPSKLPPRMKEGKKVEVIPDQMMSGSDDVYMAAAPPPSASLSNEFRHADSMAMESGGRSSQMPPEMGFPMSFQKFGVKDSLLYRTEVGSVIARRSSKGSGRSGTSGSGHSGPDKPTTPPPASRLATTFQNSGGFNPNSKGTSYKYRAGSSAPQPTSGGAYGYPNGGGLHEIDPFGSASSQKSFNPSPGGPGHISTFTSPSKAFQSISENFDNWQPSMNSGASEGDTRTGNDPLSKLIKKKALEQSQKDEEPSTSHSSMNQGFSIPSADLNYQPAGQSEGGGQPESNESFLGSFKTEGIPNLENPKEQTPHELNDESGSQSLPNSEGSPEGYHGFIPENPLGDFGSRIPENSPLGLGEGPGSDGFPGFGSGGPSAEDGSLGAEGSPQGPENFHNFGAGTPPIQEVSNDIREESSEGYVPPNKNLDEGFHKTKKSSSAQLSGPGKSDSHPQRRRKPAVLRQPNNQQQTSSSSTASHSSAATNTDQSQNFGDFGGFEGGSIPNAENSPQQELENFMGGNAPQTDGNKEESPQNPQQFTTPQSVPTIRGQGSPFQEMRGPQLGAGVNSNSYQNGPPPQYQHQPRAPQGFGGNFPHSQPSHVPNGGFGGNFNSIQNTQGPQNFGGNSGSFQHSQHGPGPNFGGFPEHFQSPQQSPGQPGFGGFPKNSQQSQPSQGRQPGFGNFNPSQNSQGQPGFGGNFNPAQNSQSQPGFGGNFNPSQYSQGPAGFGLGPSFHQPHNTQTQSFTAGFGGFPNQINNAPPPQHGGGQGFGPFPSFNSHPQHHPGQFNGFHAPAASHSASAESASQSSENEPGQQGAPPLFINGNPSNFGKMFSQGNAIQSKLQQHSQGIPSFSPEGTQGPPQPPQPPPSSQSPHSQSHNPPQGPPHSQSQGFQAHSPPQGPQHSHSQSQGFQDHSPPQGPQHSHSQGFQDHSPPQGPPHSHSQSQGFQDHSPPQGPPHSHSQSQGFQDHSPPQGLPHSHSQGPPHSHSPGFQDHSPPEGPPHAHPNSQGFQAHHPSSPQFGNSQSQGFQAQSHPPPAPQHFNSPPPGGPANHPRGGSYSHQSQGPKSLGGFSTINSVQPYNAHSTPSTPHNKDLHQPDFKNSANQQSEGKGFQNFGKFPGQFADSVLNPTASPPSSSISFTNFNTGFNTQSRQSHPQQTNFPAPPTQANPGNDGSFEDTQASFSSESSVSVEHGSPGFTEQAFNGFQHENSPLQGQHTPQQGQGPNIQIGNHALDSPNSGFGPGNPGDLRFNQQSGPGPSFAPGGNIGGIMSGNPEGGIGSHGPEEHHFSGGNVAGFMSGNPEGFGPNGPISSHPGGGGNVAGFMSGNLGGFGPGPAAHHPGGGNVGGVMSGNLGGFAPLGPLANLPGGPLGLGGPNDGGIEGGDSHGDDGPGPGGLHHGGGFNNPHSFFSPTPTLKKNPFFGALGKFGKGPLFGLGGLLKGLGANKHKNTKLASVKEKLKFPFVKAFNTILALVEKKLAFFAKFAIPKDHYLRVIGFVGVYLLFAWLYKDNEHLFQAKCENWGWNGPEEFTFHAPPYFVPALPVDPHMQREFLELFRGVEGYLDKKKEGDDKKKKKKKKHKKGKGHKNKKNNNGRSDGSSEEEEDDRSLEAYDVELNFINDMCPRTQFFYSFSPYHIEAWAAMGRLFSAQKTPADILHLARALLHDHSVNPKVWYLGLMAAAQERPDMTGFALAHPIDAIPDWFIPGHLIEGEMDRYRGLPRQKRSTFFLRDANGTIIFVTPPDLAVYPTNGDLGTTTAATTRALTSTPTSATTTRPVNVVNVTAAVLLERGYATNVNGTFDNGTSTLLRRRGDFTDEMDDDEFDEEDDDDDDDEGHNQREKNPLGYGFGVIGDALGKIKNTFQQLGHGNDGDGDGDGDKKKGKGHKGKGKGKKGKKKKKDKKKCIIVDGSIGLDNAAENKLWYWREDLMVNQHHWYWHAVFQVNATVHADRRAELFFFMHRNFLARYNAERLSNGFARTAELGMFPGSLIDEGYNSHLKDVHSGKWWTPRKPHTPLTDIIHMDDPDFARDIIVTDWIALYNKFLLAIKLGKLLTAKGKFLPIRFHEGLNPLANTIEATNISVNPLYYDAFGLHNLGHLMVALAVDPHYKMQLPTGVMSETATSMRDPSFYTYHTVIDNLFEKFKQTLQPYRPYGSVWPLQWHGVDITDLKVISHGHDGPNHLTTFYIKHKFQLEPGVDRSIEKGVDKAEICAVHLDHAPFKFQITIDRKKCAKSKSGQGTVRLFMAPRYDEHGERIPYSEQRRLMFQLDAFQVDLKVGRNVITRNSIDNALTKPWSRSLRDYQRGPNPSGAADYCGCGWPIHLFIPKGNTKGMPFDLFAMVTNFDEDFVADHPADLEFPETCNSPYIFCGRPRRRYPDARPMGYPFDRISYRVPVQHCGPGLTLKDLLCKIAGKFFTRPVATLEEYVSGVSNMAMTVFEIKHIPKVVGKHYG